MNVNILDEVKEAEQVASVAQQRLNELKSIEASFRSQLEKNLCVGGAVPCKVARLNDHQYVVHMLVGSSSYLHIVELTEIET